MRGQLQGQAGQIPGAARHHPAETVTPPPGGRGQDVTPEPACDLMPSSVIAAVATARMMMSGVHPSSVLGTAICRKYMAKSKAPSNSPSATAPCPAAIASAVTTSLTIVKMSPDRLGM